MARRVTSVNWIFKEHPGAEFYPSKDVDLDAIFKGEGCSHILFLKRRADLNARSLRYLADSITTCIGTAGLEFSCLGIPLHELQPLDETQIEVAKIVMFFQLSMMQGGAYLFCPYYNYWEIREIKADELWKDAADLMRKADVRELDRQVWSVAEFVADGSWTQYIDLDRYRFMKDAIELDRISGTHLIEKLGCHPLDGRRTE